MRLPGNPRILVTNDDGIHAPGIASLETIARALSDDVWVIAPLAEQSGASHSLTLHAPLRVRKEDDRHFAVQGTPTDCVSMAIKHILADHPPALVLSGVNHGSNIAEDVTYSGTIAAAMEGTTLGVRSIALSQAFGFKGDGRLRLQTAEHFGPRLVSELWERPWAEGVLININFPDRDPDDVAGIEATRQGRRDQSNLYIEQRTDPRGGAYYWLGINRKLSNPPEGTDLRAIYSGRISVTPLHLDLTQTDSLAILRGAVEEARAGLGLSG
ncbi:MAG: 5'/3'-nucleotidase SurE [Alphaproteobacteria bacterium]|nr:5'/3'-nucleotidase SurE [Alphaproteobacteria bacterium]